MTKSQPQTNPTNNPNKRSEQKPIKLPTFFVIFAFSIVFLSISNLVATFLLLQEVHHSNQITTHNHNHFNLNINQSQGSNSTFHIMEQDFNSMVNDVLLGGDTITIHQKSNISTLETVKTLHFDRCEVEKSAVDGSVEMMSCDVTHVVGESSYLALRNRSRRSLGAPPMFGGVMCCGVCDSRCGCCSSADNDLCCDMNFIP